MRLKDVYRHAIVQWRLRAKGLAGENCLFCEYEAGLGHTCGYPLTDDCCRKCHVWELCRCGWWAWSKSPCFSGIASARFVYDGLVEHWRKRYGDLPADLAWEVEDQPCG